MLDQIKRQALELETGNTVVGYYYLENGYQMRYGRPVLSEPVERHYIVDVNGCHIEIAETTLEPIEEQRQNSWISVNTEEPPLEKEVLVKYESGIVTTGWRRQFRPDDILYCLGTKEGNWDMEINNNLGGVVVEWMPIP